MRLTYADLWELINSRDNEVPIVFRDRMNRMDGEVRWIDEQPCSNSREASVPIAIFGLCDSTTPLCAYWKMHGERMAIELRGATDNFACFEIDEWERTDNAIVLTGCSAPPPRI